jgi:hypothetical protein
MKDPMLAYQTQSQIQILSGWNAENAAVLEFETRAAARRCGAQLDELHIILPHEMDTTWQKWNAYLSRYNLHCALLKKNDEGRSKLPIRKFFGFLLRFGFLTSKPSSFLTINKNAIVLSTVLLPVIVHIVNSKYFDAWGIVYDITSSIITYVYLSVNLAFLSATIFDAQRRHSVARALTLMMRVEDEIDIDDLNFRDIPKLDLDLDASNIYAWLYARLLLQNFGERMLFRMELYVGAYLLVAVALAVIFITGIYSAADPWAVLARPFYIQVAIILFAALLLVQLHIAEAAAVNTEMETHQHSLQLNITKIQARLAWKSESESHTTAKDIEKLKLCVFALENALSATKVSDRSNPLRVFGIPASGGLLTSVTTTSIGVLSSIFAALSKSRASVSSSSTG